MLKKLKDKFGVQVMREPAPGSGPAMVRPVGLSEAQALVRFARENDHEIVPCGSGTKRHWLEPPMGPVIEMDMRSLARSIEYSPEDMTITVQSGMALSALSSLLQSNGQRVTIDPPHAEIATLGGVLAANDSGPTRLAYGTARDVVIGMSAIDAEGELIHSGGKVVKNVAGYDLHKLYIGSFGVLGPIATVTLKLRPIPEAKGMVLLQPASDAEAEEMIAATLAGETRPTMIELLNARAAVAVGLERAMTLVIGYEENREAVQWQCEHLQSRLGGSVLDSPTVRTLYDKLRELPGTSVETSFKATVLSSEVASFIQRADRWPMRLISHAGNGVVYGLLDAPLDEGAWRELESWAEAGRGHLVIRGKCPSAIDHRFGRHRGDARISTGIQRAFDPDTIFAPERIG